jgi:hypothetical protein
VAGIVWPYLQPLLVIAAYYLVLDIVFAMRLGTEAPVRAVGAFLIVGSLPWMAFCDAMSRGANSLIDASSILQKNALPVVLFPVKAVLASAVIFGPLFILVAICYTPFHHFFSGTDGLVAAFAAANNFDDWTGLSGGGFFQWLYATRFSSLVSFCPSVFTCRLCFSPSAYSLKIGVGRCG